MLSFSDDCLSCPHTSVIGGIQTGQYLDTHVSVMSGENLEIKELH